MNTQPAVSKAAGTRIAGNSCKVSIVSTLRDTLESPKDEDRVSTLYISIKMQSGLFSHAIASAGKAVPKRSGSHIKILTAPCSLPQNVPPFTRCVPHASKPKLQPRLWQPKVHKH